MLTQGATKVSADINRRNKEQADLIKLSGKSGRAYQRVGQPLNIKEGDMDDE